MYWEQHTASIEYADKVMERLDGDYTFAAYDGKDLVAVRDPLGVKPLYYGNENGIFGFASEKRPCGKWGLMKPLVYPLIQCYTTRKPHLHTN